MDDPTKQISFRPKGKQENPDVLHAKIQQTKVAINETVNTIQQRLTPGRLKQQMKAVARGRVESMTHQARITADDWRFNITERISNNPLPVVMAGVGLVWLMKQAMNAAQAEQTLDEKYYSLTPEEEWPEFRPEVASGRSAPAHGRAEDVRARAQTYGEETGERISRWTTQARESANEFQSRAQEQTSRLKTHAQAKAGRAKGEFQSLLHENPLAVGATLFAVGAAIGLSLPRTQRENEWLGETRDRVLEQAKTTVQAAGNKVKAMAGDMIDEVKSAAEEVAKESRKI